MIRDNAPLGRHRLHRRYLCSDFDWPDSRFGRLGVEDQQCRTTALSALFEEGIRAIGVSNFSVEQMTRFRRVAPLHVLQPPYNLFERAIEAQILPYSRANGIATLGYGALCRGLSRGSASHSARIGRLRHRRRRSASSRPGGIPAAAAGPVS